MTGTSPAQLRRDYDGAVEIRELAYSDLPGVIAIERRVFPTPWSLAMFVLELSKETGVCLAASERSITAGEPRLIGYLICSRYDTVWHIMNLAIDADRQHQGLAAGCSASCTGASATITPASRSRYGAPMMSPSSCMSARVSARPVRGAATTRTTARTRS